MLNNDNLLKIFFLLLSLAREETRPYFYIQVPVGIGKTFLFTVWYYYYCAKKKIVFCVTSSSIALLLLPGGRTSHS